MWRAVAGISLVLVGAAFAPSGGTLHAQYARPTGSVVLSSETIAPALDSRTTLTCRVVDTAGQPLVSAPCTFTIDGEPGTDAAVGSKTITRYTDANGVATTSLYTGTTPGTIVVRVTSTELSSLVVVDVKGNAPRPPAAPIEGAAGIRPPTTGDAGLKD